MIFLDSVVVNYLNITSKMSKHTYTYSNLKTKQINIIDKKLIGAYFRSSISQINLYCICTSLITNAFFIIAKSHNFIWSQSN